MIGAKDQCCILIDKRDRSEISLRIKRTWVKQLIILILVVHGIQRRYHRHGRRRGISKVKPFIDLYVIRVSSKTFSNPVP